MTTKNTRSDGFLSDFLSHANLAKSQSHKSITLWPLVFDGDAGLAAGPAYQTLADALERGTLQIDEVSEHGSVPNVKVTNTGEVDVLFLFGEEILGAKQNRIANATFLVPAKSEVVLDVSCVEAGRWHRSHGARFRSAEGFVSASVRQKMARKVQEARASGQRFRADQREVWDEIDARLSASGTRSSTSAYEDYRSNRARDTEELLAAFRPIANQVGFVVCIGDEVVGLEAIGKPEVFEAQFDSLFRSYAIDAVDSALVKERGGAPLGESKFDSPEPFLEALASAPISRGPSLGRGEDVRIEGPEVGGCALEYQGLVHLVAFPKVEGKRPTGRRGDEGVSRGSGFDALGDPLDWLVEQAERNQGGEGGGGEREAG